MNQRLLQNLLESIRRELVHFLYAMNLDLTNCYSYTKFYFLSKALC